MTKLLNFKIVGLAVAIALVLTGSLSVRPQAAEAHPLGNFTVNRFARIELLPSGEATVRYVIDMAEIAAFQEKRGIDRDGNGIIGDEESAAYLNAKVPQLTSRMQLSVGGKTLPLRVATRDLSFPPGQGGLTTMRLVIDYAATLPSSWTEGSEASFKDANYTDRIGWREIVVIGRDGVALTATSAALSDTTAELTAYPIDELKSAPDRREVNFRFEAGPSVVVPQTLDSTAGRSAKPSKTLDGFAGLVSREDLTPAFILVSLLAAFAWGAAHALGPGHGKTIVAAYLVGSRGTAKHALILGASVTVAHTAGVVTLGLVALSASQFVQTEEMFLWLSVISALMVAAMGLFLLTSRLRAMAARAPGHGHSHGGHDHDHSHGHGQEHTDEHSHGGHGHSHSVPEIKGVRSLIALGVSAGILPCPTALVVMLGAIALDRTVYGLVLVGAFSLGLAGVLTGIGVLLVYASRMLNGVSDRFAILRSGFARGLLQAAPVLSAAAILVVGIVMSTRSLASVL